MRERILVINPNSNKAVTKAMDEALDPLRAAPDIAIECETLPDGPLGIESQRDVDAVAPLVCRKGRIVLELPGEFAPLASERLLNRVRALGKLLDCEAVIQAG